VEKWSFYRNDAGEWCWRLVDDEGRSVRECAEVFHSRRDCIADAMREGYMEIDGSESSRTTRTGI
jgi:hypothetical protein